MHEEVIDRGAFEMRISNAANFSVLKLPKESECSSFPCVLQKGRETRTTWTVGLVLLICINEHMCCILVLLSLQDSAVVSAFSKPIADDFGRTFPTIIRLYLLSQPLVVQE
uniref:Uncharacterized protein n=1 Tax=Glossina austeni TaxID=7395 RepID=A0A1A9VPH5_GLOAU